MRVDSPISFLYVPASIVAVWAVVEVEERLQDIGTLIVMSLVAELSAKARGEERRRKEKSEKKS